MRKVIFAALMMVSLTSMAQSNWEVPQSQQAQQTVEKTKEQLKAEKAAAKAAAKNESTVVIDGKTYTIKDADRPYLKGAVPEVDGKVVFTLDSKAHGRSAQEIYDIVYSQLEKIVAENNAVIPDKSRIAIINKGEHSIAASFTEWMTFTNKILVLDRSLFQYVIIATCTDGNLHMTIERLTYDYQTGNTTNHFAAEDLISDKEMLTNNGTKMRKNYSKFRRATVDRMKQITETIRTAVE